MPYTPRRKDGTRLVPLKGTVHCDVHSSLDVQVVHQMTDLVLSAQEGRRREFELGNRPGAGLLSDRRESDDSIDVAENVLVLFVPFADV